MQMFQVYGLDRVFVHKLHHPPCCLGNFADYGRQVHEGDRDTRSQSQNEEGPPLLSLQGTSVRFRRNLPHWSISEGLIRWCLSVIMRFTYSFFCWWSFTGQVSVKFILPCHFKLRHQKRRPFISDRDVCQNDFWTLRWLSAVFVFQIKDILLGFQSDKWSLNNHDAIEIKSKGFYASSVTIPYTFRI